jgi:hypothetical protein
VDGLALEIGNIVQATFPNASGSLFDIHIKDRLHIQNAELQPPIRIVPAFKHLGMEPNYRARL